MTKCKDYMVRLFRKLFEALRVYAAKRSARNEVAALYEAKQKARAEQSAHIAAARVPRKENQVAFIVRYITFDDPGWVQRFSPPSGPWISAQTASLCRDELFSRLDVTLCWVERTIDGEIQSRYGAVLRKAGR